MITLKGTEPVIWSKSYYVKTIEEAKEKHDDLYPEYIVEEAFEEKDFNIFRSKY